MKDINIHIQGTQTIKFLEEYMDKYMTLDLAMIFLTYDTKNTGNKIKN